VVFTQWHSRCCDICYDPVSGCLSVCPSQTGVDSKCLNVSPSNQRRTIGLRPKRSAWTFNRDTPITHVGWKKMRFSTNNSPYLGIGIRQGHERLHQMVTLRMTLSDLHITHIVLIFLGPVILFRRKALRYRSISRLTMASTSLSLSEIVPNDARTGSRDPFKLLRINVVTYLQQFRKVAETVQNRNI